MSTRVTEPGQRQTIERTLTEARRALVAEVFAQVAQEFPGVSAFNAGTHHELVRMAYADYDRLVHPKHAAVGVPRRSREETGWTYDG